MKLQFEEEVAIDVWVDEAIMYSNLQYWCEKNKANDKHYYDWNYRTYNSMKAFTELFKFWSEKQIRRILDNLEASWYIKTGNYNKVAYDRTKWYACICPNGQMELTKKENGTDQMVEPIPNSNTNNNTNIDPNGSMLWIFDDGKIWWADSLEVESWIVPPSCGRPPAEYVPSPKTIKINNLLDLIKESCIEAGVVHAPDPKDRRYANNILSMKFKKDCLDQLNMDLEQFIPLIVKLSSQLKYGKVLANAKSIYYDRWDTINRGRQQKWTEKQVYSYT